MASPWYLKLDMPCSNYFGPKFSDRYVAAESNQGLQCMSFCMHFLDALLYNKATIFI